MSADFMHVPLFTLWECRFNIIFMSDSEIEHLNGCDQCILTLRLCQTSESIREVRLRLDESVF